MLYLRTNLFNTLPLPKHTAIITQYTTTAIPYNYIHSIYCHLQYSYTALPYVYIDAIHYHCLCDIYFPSMHYQCVTATLIQYTTTAIPFYYTFSIYYHCLAFLLVLLNKLPQFYVTGTLIQKPPLPHLTAILSQFTTTALPYNYTYLIHDHCFDLHLRLYNTLAATLMQYNATALSYSYTF